jgi:hypothetical protein
LIGRRGMRTALPLFTVAIVVVAPLMLVHCVGDSPGTVVVTGDGGGDTGTTVDGNSNSDANNGAQDSGVDSQSPVDAGSKDAGPKQVFVTSGLFDGKFNAAGKDGGGGPTAADARCMEAAAAAFPGRTFHAWIAVGTTAASARVGTGPWFVGSAPFGDLTLLTNAGTPITVPLTENGTPPDDPKLAWTGTDVNGAAPTDGDPLSQTDCTDWTDSTSTGSGNVGVVEGANGFWTDSNPSNPCDTHLRIYCFEQ